jgi:glycosyltransferase involved in cell wall biosynthesis
MVRELKKLGHEVAISASVGACGVTELWHGIKVFPDSGHVGKYGMDSVKTHYKKWGADLVISWLDAFVIPPEIAKELNWAAWVPVDSEPLMIRNVDPLKATKWQFAPTKWGVGMLREAGFKNAMLLPCAHDPKVFHVLPDRMAARKEFGRLINLDLTGKYLINVVSCNAGGRKNFQANFCAWSIFKHMHPEAILYIHADITGYHTGGSDLVEMAKTYDVHDDRMIFVAQWEYNTGQIGQNYLNLLYNASDLHLNCCYGEGFGLPIMDAQAAGCPTVTPYFAAARETGLCYKVVEGEMYSTVPGAMQFMVSPEAVVNEMERAYTDRWQSEERLGLSLSTGPWQIDRVSSEFLGPLLKKIEGELK